MGCCKSESKTKEPSSSDSEVDFSGPLHHRECRDLFFLILFIAFLVGSGGVTYMAVKQGNPYRLIYGVDSWGNVCKQKNDVIPNVTLSGQDNSNKPKVFFFDPNYFTKLLPKPPKTINEDKSQIICVEKCPDREVDVIDFYTEDGVNLCRYDVTNVAANVDDDEKCPNSPVAAHFSKFNRCIPEALYEQLKGTIKSFTAVMANVNVGGNITENIISDLANTWKEIGYLGAISVGVALIVVIAMRLLAAVIVWTIVIFTVALCLAASAYSWYNMMFSTNANSAYPIQMPRQRRVSCFGSTLFAISVGRFSQEAGY